MLSQWRRHSRWSMFSIFLIFGLICNGDLAPLSVPDATLSSSTSSRSLGDFSWGWLFTLDTQDGLQSGMDSATLLRRIKPKSVFIAPALPACADGYVADDKGRCVKNVNLDMDKHRTFLLGRLNAKYATNQESQKTASTGPLQLNIPLIPNTNLQSAVVEVDEMYLKNPSVTVRVRNQTNAKIDEEKTKATEPHESNLYDTKNDTLNEQESTFSFESVDNIGKINQKLDPLILLEKTNTNTNFSEVQDYKVPINLKTLLNSSNKKINLNDDTKEDVSMAEKKKNSTETSSQSLLLLISPTKFMNIVNDLPSTQNNTAEQISQISNQTSGTTTKENIGMSDSTLPPKRLTSIPLDEQRDNETYAEDELTSETSTLNDSQETEFYDEEQEDYPYSTDIPEDEDSTEVEGEILKHGEAGMTIPMRNIERLDRDRDQQQRNRSADLREKMPDIRDQIMIRFNDSVPENKDEAESNISSEVSIDGDLILETTLLDVNTERLQITTKSPDVNQKIVKDSDDEKESSDKNPDIESKIVFSEDAQSAKSTSSHGQKSEQTERFSIRLENEKNKESKGASSSSESLLYDPPEDDPITEVATTDEEQSNVKGNTPQENPPDSNVLADNLRPTTVNLESSDEDFVRFPDYVRQSQRSDYVRFPSSKVNSIHSPSYKQDLRSSTDDLDPYDSTSTKSSVPVRQKPVYSLTASSWKPDRSQSDRVQATTSKRQKHRSDLLHFWNKMPLIEDPVVIYPFDQDDDQPIQFRFPSRRRRMSSSAETSPENINRVTQKQRTPIDV
ncbi:LOW QUALITY PROTEIN: uncharacterized protein LOC105430898 [Pogonomyrmex barbatus]|uniref:LOW QUALITY PROTEIN: uncharacterized protein LOC105430898 n=1 Tax=Pogonomyrmex barbatus TaxID=144034 RepID=A0A6I9WIX4_9HYME|nr:LOW QUALITY PROTEIN: uncharacterized protein LOC105430898 [Pogonomyrmex barbatus]